MADDPRPSCGLAFLAEYLRSDLWLDLDGCEATLTRNASLVREVRADEVPRPEPWLTITYRRRRPPTWPDLTDPLLVQCVRDAGYRPLTPGEHRVLEDAA